MCCHFDTYKIKDKRISRGVADILDSGMATVKYKCTMSGDDDGRGRGRLRNELSQLRGLRTALQPHLPAFPLAQPLASSPLAECRPCDSFPGTNPRVVYDTKFHVCEKIVQPI